MRRIFMVAGVLWAFPFLAAGAQGPFGINAGDRYDHPQFEAFREIEPTEPGLVALMGEKPPLPHSLFETYAIQFHPEEGACWGQARGPIHRDDRYGSTVRARMERVRGQLSDSYGSPGEEVDRLLPGALWDGAEYWSRALQSNERFYFYQWEPDPVDPQKRVKALSLIARAARSNDTRMVLEWQFDNWAECQSVGDQLDRGAF
ncbi:hypothetical protein TVD_06120 [Thioalkalivibrio versutus]|uniref:Uncharacterized protein n=1 Tax=Thioalkalivibrio versutus TaxID=106634 RepID=A0A0G3G151_9GAMM|nr:hypothetical protein [Thioalkalivibrio versutus]AKJ94958.1 hypothetical protein TVD_06120 [Thioalkalivibrio versutus]